MIFLCRFLLFTLLLSIAGQLAFAVPADEAAWRLVSNKQGIKVYMQHREGSRLKTFRGVTVMQVNDWQAIGAVINDYANAPRWLQYVSSVQEFGRHSPLDRDMIFQTELPWPVADREAVVRAHGWTPPGTHDLAIRFENAPGLLPPNEDYVRCPAFNARFDFHWLGGNRVQVVYEMVLDPGGYIPEWITNILLQDAPFLTLKRLAKVINHPEYQGQHLDYIIAPPDFGVER